MAKAARRTKQGPGLAGRTARRGLRLGMLAAAVFLGRKTASRKPVPSRDGDRQGTAAHLQGDDQQVLMRLASPVTSKTHASGAGQWAERLAAKPLGEVLRLEPFVVQQARPAFHRGFLVALGARKCCLAASLLVNDRGHECRDRFALMAVCPRQ